MKKFIGVLKGDHNNLIYDKAMDILMGTTGIVNHRGRAVFTTIQLLIFVALAIKERAVEVDVD